MAVAVVLTIFSVTGPIPTKAWDTKTSALLPALVEGLGITSSSRKPNASMRYLDKAASSTYPAHRVADLLLTLPGPTDSTEATSSVPSATPSQARCTEIARSLRGLAKDLNVAVALQPLSPLHRLYFAKEQDSRSASSLPSAPSHTSPPPRLALFDIDSTLIQQEVIDELARSLGLYEQVAAITEAAMRGDEPYGSDFSASLRARVALLQGVDSTSVWDALKEGVISFTPGARELVRCLSADGWATGVASGGFVDLAQWVAAELGVGFFDANALEVDAQGLLTGKLREGHRIVDGARKREVLVERATGLGIEAGVEGSERNWTLAVGDGSNDLLMMGAAGLGVAFNAKPKVQEKAPAVVNGESLVDVLYILGWTEEEIKGVMSR